VPLSSKNIEGTAVHLRTSPSSASSLEAAAACN